MLIAVIGDCLLDISVRPSRPMRLGADAPAAIRLSPGGQGANVAVRLARRGARVRLITGLADDPTGRFLREAMDAEGVELVAMPVAASGSVIALLDGDGERTMLSDRAPFAVEDLPDFIADAGWVHVSGYALRDANGAALAQLLSQRTTSVRLSIGGGSVPPGDEAAEAAERLSTARADVLMLSRDEAEHLGADLATLVVVTEGAAGSSALGVTPVPLHVPARVLTEAVVDATGAGDAYAAALIKGLAALATWPPSAEDLRQAMVAASDLGAAVSRIGGAQGRVARERASEQAIP
ncbi:MAG TPA: carbohydrate kinase family protein [Candidatus Limnocylindria bacterium]|nr:carbohydrate kinase family protein [Candidatus Limnocylindria bacterium]